MPSQRKPKAPAGRSKRPTSSHGSLGKWRWLLLQAVRPPPRFSPSPINSKRAGFSNCYRRVAGPGRFSPSSINSKRAGFSTQRRGAGPVRFSRRRSTPSGQALPPVSRRWAGWSKHRDAAPSRVAVKPSRSTHHDVPVLTLLSRRAGPIVCTP